MRTKHARRIGLGIWSARQSIQILHNYVGRADPLTIKLAALRMVDYYSWRMPALASRAYARTIEKWYEREVEKPS